MKLKKTYIWNGLFIIAILAFIFVPDSKAMLLRGLMQIGFFKPDIEQATGKPENLSGIVFKDSKGTLVDLGDLKGKVIFLNFWATWCPPCVAEMPSVNKLYEQFKNNDHVVFLLVDADSNHVKAKQFMDKRGYDLPVYTAESNVPEQIFTGSLPTTVIFDKEGRISFKHVGAANYNDKRFSDFLKKLVE